MARLPPSKLKQLKFPQLAVPPNNSDLHRNCDRTHESVYHGVVIYLEVLEYVQARIQNNEKVNECLRKLMYFLLTSAQRLTQHVVRYK